MDKVTPNSQLVTAKYCYFLYSISSIDYFGPQYYPTDVMSKGWGGTVGSVLAQ